MASFNAFWAGPDKFSFSTLYQQNQYIFPSDHSRLPPALYNDYRDEGSHDDLNPYGDASSLSDAEYSSSIDAPSLTDSDNSDFIWGDVSESSGASAFEQDDENYESQMDSEYDNAPYAMLHGDDISLKRHQPVTMPSFMRQPTPLFNVYTEAQAQPYFYLPQANQLHHMQPAPVAFNMSTSSVPQLSSLSNHITIHHDATAQIPSTTPRKRSTKKQVRPRDDDDEEYRAEEEGNVDIMHKSCRVNNCLVCNRDLPESLRVAQPSWASILRIVFYTLKVNYPHKEFFNLRSHVYDFVDAHWERICIGKTKSEHWKKQLQDTLAHNKKLFASGAEVYKQKGFWRLDDLTDPWDDSGKGGSVTHHSNGGGGHHILPKYTPALASSTLVAYNNSMLNNSMEVISGADDEDDEYNPVPARRRKTKAHKKAKVDQLYA